MVAHVGPWALGPLADPSGDRRSAVGLHLVDERPPAAARPGKGLVQTALALAGGGASCADVEQLRLQPDLFTSVPPDSTAFRTFHELTVETTAPTEGAISEVGSTVWSCATKTAGRSRWSRAPTRAWRGFLSPERRTRALRRSGA